MAILEAVQHTLHTVNTDQESAERDRRAAQRHLRASEALVQAYALRLSRNAHHHAPGTSRSVNAGGAGPARQTDHRPASIEHSSLPATNARPNRDRVVGGRSHGRAVTFVRGTGGGASLPAAAATA